MTTKSTTDTTTATIFNEQPIFIGRDTQALIYLCKDGLYASWAGVRRSSGSPRERTVLPHQETASNGDTSGISDAMLIRAAVAFGMMKRRGMLSATLDKMGEQHAIALIAGNFADDPPSTPQRAAMFAMTLDEAPRG